MPDPNRDLAAILEHLRERDQSQSERIAELLAEVTRRVDSIDQRGAAHAEKLDALDAAVIGTAAAPGLNVRVDRIEQAILLLRWFFGGGLVAAAAAIVLMWKFGESLSKAS